MASDVHVNLLKFEKLNGSNYRSWSFNIRLYLESLDLFGHAEGTAELPGEDASAKVRENFNRNAKKAWSHICLAIEPEYQIHVRDTTTAKEAWDSLKSQFARESLLKKVRLRQQYYSCRYRSGGNMLEHINHLKSLHDQLKEMGINVDDKELAMTLLTSLPEEFKPLITALDAVGDDNLSFDKVKNMLLNDVDRTNTSSQRNPDGAFAAGRNFQKKGKQNVFKGKCHNCQERGHFARDCPKKSSSNCKKSNKGPSVHCVENDSSFMEDEALLTSSLINNPGWIIDSGATQHMTFVRENLSEYVEFKQPSSVNLGDNRSILAYGKGVCRLVADLDGRTQNVSLRDVLYVPDLEKNLLSVRAMVKLGANVMFTGDKCEVTRNSKLLAVGEIVGKLYMLKIVQNEEVNIAKDESNLKLWHYRYGHLGMDYVSKLINDKMVTGMDTVHDERNVACEGCIMGKHHRTKYPKGKAKRATKPFELVHSDVCGPMSVNSIGGSRYFVTFIDDLSRYTYVYFIKHKHEVLEKFKEFVSLISNITDNTIKVLRSDNGGEYCSKAFEAYLKEHGISHQLTVPYNPAQNGVAERMNRTIVESARSMLSHSNLSNEFWAEAINTSVYLRNRCPSVALSDVTPYECLFNEKPDVSNLRIFGCMAYVHIPECQRKKLDAKSRKLIFVGYPEGVKGYKLYNPESCSFVRSRDVIFSERKFYDFKNKQFRECSELQEVKEVSVEFEHGPTPVIENDEEEAEDDIQNEHDHDVEVEVQPVGATYEESFMNDVQRLPEKRQRKPPTRYDEECYIASDFDEPTNIKDAFSGEHANEWKSAIQSEYDSLMDNNTWNLVPRPSDKNVIGNRWVFKVKRCADGSLERFKARLVAQGYTQSQGVDYQEVFAPVARYNSIRSLLAVANVCDWEIHQMDVKTAFLHGNLEEEIFMEQPEGFVNEDQPDFVCKLNKSLYGLKQAARCWNISIDNYLMSSGYKKCSADSCVYIKSVKSESGKIDFVIIAIYVDDMIFFSNNTKMLEKEKSDLAKKFRVEDLGELHYVLGMCIKRNRRLRTLSITQTKYLEGLLKRLNMENCKPVSTPLEPNTKYQPLAEDEKPVDVKEYQIAIGSITYVTTISRPDLSAALGILSKFMANPGTEHWKGIKRILRYIKGTLNYGLLYSCDGTIPILIGYSDADWGGDLSTRRSTSGYVFQIQGNTVSWCSKRQACVSKSTTEAEYIALSTASQEGVWLRRLLNDISIKQDDATIIYEDNQGAIELSRNPKFHNRTKHIDVCYHYIREKVNQNLINVKYCASNDMLADVMTKGLSKVQFEKFRNMLGVVDVKF